MGDFPSSPDWPKRGVSDQEGALDRTVHVFLTNSFKLQNRLVTWLKPSNQRRGLRLTPSLTAVHQIG